MTSRAGDIDAGRHEPSLPEDGTPPSVAKKGLGAAARSGALGGIIAALPAAAPAVVALCASCAGAGLGAAIAVGSALGAASPLVFGVAGAVMLLGTRAILGRCRSECPPRRRRRALLARLTVLVIVGVASYGLAVAFSRLLLYASLAAGALR